MKNQSEILKTKANDYYNVDPRNIVIDEKFNVRQDYGDIESLALSIVNHGQIEPIIASKIRGTETFQLIDGFRRMRAINYAISKGHEIPYVKLMVQTGNEEERIFAMVITGIEKKTLNPIEEGEAYKRLINFSYTPQEIAVKVGKSIPHVYNVLKLADAPKVVKNAIIENKISATTVSQIIREVKDVDQVITIVTDAINKAKENGGSGKATAKSVNVTKMKTPMQKLCEAHEILMNQSKVETADNLFNLIEILKDKKSTSKQIAKKLNELF